MRSIVEQVFRIAQNTPQQTALIDGKRSISYGQLSRGVAYACKKLQKDYYLQQGDCIILAANKQISFVYAYLAAHLSGVIAVPIDPETNERRFSFILDKIRPRLVVGFLNHADSIDIDNFNGELAFLHEEINFPELDTIADIIFTTGTTGHPKGVTLTHRNIAAAAGNINSFIQNTEEDVELLALPVSHSFGLGRLRCILSKGATLVLLGSFVNMKRFYRFIEEYKVSGLAMVPASWAFLKKMSGERLGNYARQIHYMEIGSAPMPTADKRLLCKLFPYTRICMHYGLTEASRSTFMEFHSDYDHLTTIGHETPGMTVAILDEQGNPCRAGEEGELCVKGEAVTRGYYDDPEITAQSFWGDYFRTGDWGTADADGYISLKSRKKELINVGGKKVSPLEVEEVLMQVVGIADCACVGRADENGVLGEVVEAFIVLSDKNLDTTTINDRISGKLEAYKLPAFYSVTDEIPRTSSGKVQRLLLKKIK